MSDFEDNISETDSDLDHGQDSVQPVADNPDVELESSEIQDAELDPDNPYHLAETGFDEEYLPAMKLLKPGRKSEDGEDAEQGHIRVLNELFAQFNVNAEIVGCKRGPRVTRFEIKMGRGTRIDAIAKLKDEIKYSLGVSRVNILAPIPGLSLVGIEVARLVPDIVSLRDILDTSEAKRNKQPLLVAIGKDVDGSPVLEDIAEMPHLLVAGATGSGKSCFINALICSVLVRTLPEQVRLVLIDPKRVEFAQFREVPHLALPVISESEEALAALAWAVTEMESRYQLLERHRVNRIDRYNAQSTDFQDRYPKDPLTLPRILIVIDELADLIHTTDREAEKLIVRLSQKGRAAGIHLVVATQRPSVNVITGTIKANISCRLAFATASQVDSRVILDAVGAENLSGEGDGLLMMAGIGATTRVQGAYVDEDEIVSVVNFVIENVDNPTTIYPWGYSSEISGSSESMADTEQRIEIVKSAGVDEPLEHEESSVLTDAIGDLVSSASNISDPNSEDAIPLTSTMIEFEEFTEPDWREIVDLLERRIEPCDITGAMVKVSRKRAMWRSIETALARVRVRVISRLADRAEFRFKDRIDQDQAVTEAQQSLHDWTHDHSHSVAWKFHAQAIAQLELSQEMRKQAIERVTSKVSFRNEVADDVYLKFVKSTFVPSLSGLYIYSVLVLTDDKFHWILKYFPLFNQGTKILGIIVAGITSVFVFRALWSYTSSVALTQRDFVQANRDYADAVATITHAYEEEVRLEQQIVNIEPLLEVLARGYNSRWSIDESLNVDVSTQLDTSEFPACVGFARAVQGPDDQVAQLQDLALRQVVRPGWRTEIIQKLGEQFGEKNRTLLSFEILDRDLGSSTAGARGKYLAAFNDLDLAKRLGREKLFELVNLIHNSVLRNPNTLLRPPVLATRVNGFEDIDTSSAWLTDKVDTENWVEYLSEILQEAPPFSPLNLTGSEGAVGFKGSIVNSYAVVPKYLSGSQHESVQIEPNPFDLIAPVDIAVRVDVSDWGTLDSFLIFEDDGLLEHSNVDVSAPVEVRNYGV